jgi:3-oxoacyl-[acyl-carrier protein] reductase
VAIGYAGNTAAAQKTVSEIEAHGATAVAIRSNLLDVDVGEQLVKAALAGLKTDTIHIVVNNAALAAMQYNKPLFDLTPEL